MARIAEHVVQTPVLRANGLDQTLGARVHVKAESLQITGAFKYRGALNKVLQLDDSSLRNGVIAYSAGNHAAAVAAAARTVGTTAVVVVPSTAPQSKIDNCKEWGAEVVLFDPIIQDRTEITSEIAARRGLSLIPPFDDYDVMTGAGTVGLEFAESLRVSEVAPDAVLVSCSGGGLAFAP